MCIELLRSPARSQKRLGAQSGRNSRVFRVELEDDRTVLFKFYRHDSSDTRNRLDTEFRAVQFMWENDIRVVPSAIARKDERHCGVYQFIEGEAPDLAGIASADVDALLDFLATLQPLRTKARAIGIASEASFSLAGIIENLAARVHRLRQNTAAYPALHQWFEESFYPLVQHISDWSARESAGQSVRKELDHDQRTLSPSDFGFHNAIRRPSGLLAFVDFEYFGWDDPAKTVADFLLHPGMLLSQTLKKRFADGFLQKFAFVRDLPARARIVYPLYGLKWCLILLNDFLPDRETTATRAVRETQLEKAAALTERIRREYRENPFV
jgi:phosphotransferase family enzyme